MDLFRNLGSGKFSNMTASVGAAFATPRVARGAAYADIDNDGDVDLLQGAISALLSANELKVLRVEFIRPCGH